MIDVPDVRFADLLSPITEARFFEEHWERRSLHVRGGAEKLRRLFAFDRRALLSSLAASLDRPAPRFKAQYIDASGAHVEFDPPPGDPLLAEHLVNAGLTICVPRIETIAPSVAALVTAIDRAFRRGKAARRSTRVAAYMSGHGGGYGMHFDAHPVLVVQCEGRKRWRFGDAPSVRAPGGNCVDVVDFVREHPESRVHVPIEESLLECTLEPGDILFLPGGTWHRTYADGFSLGLTFGFPYDEALDVVTRRLRAALGARPAWRAAVPEGEAEAEAFARARLGELRSAASALDVDAIVHDGVAATRARDDRDGGSIVVAPDDRLRIVAKAGFYTRATGDDRGEVLGCVGPDDAIEVPLAFAPLFERIASCDAIVASEVATWEEPGADDWESVRTALESLCEIGVARRTT